MCLSPQPLNEPADDDDEEEEVPVAVDDRLTSRRPMAKHERFNKLNLNDKLRLGQPPTPTVREFALFRGPYYPRTCAISPRTATHTTHGAHKIAERPLSLARARSSR